MTETTSKHVHEHKGEACHGRKDAPASPSQQPRSDEEAKQPSKPGGCCG